MSRTVGYVQEQANRAQARAFLTWMIEQRNRSPKTVYQYGNRLESFLGAVGGRRLDSLTLHDLEGWVARGRVNGTGVRKPASRSMDVAILKSFYKYLVGHGRVEMTADPTVLLQGPTVHNTAPKALDDETWRKLWASSIGDEDRVLLGLGFFLGLRREEMCSIKASHFDLKRRQLVDFVRKGGNSDVLPYGSCVEIVAQKLPDLIEDPDHYLSRLESLVRAREGRYVLPWGDGLRSDRCHSGIPDGMTNPDDINKRIERKILPEVGCARFTAHGLRHSFVTNLLRCDVPIHVVSRLANHSSVTVTMRYVKLGTDPLAAFMAQDDQSAPLASTRW